MRSFFFIRKECTITTGKSVQFGTLSVLAAALKRLVKIAGRSIARQHEQGPRHSFLAGIEELVYEVFFDSNVSSQHVSDEAVGKIVFFVKHPNHLFFPNPQHGRGRERGR